MSNPVKATVIVPAYNAAATLAECLDSLITQQLSTGLELEIIVVDDGSIDQTAAIAKCYNGRGVRLIQTPHRGASAARNVGIKATSTTCPIILFTDADCIAAPDWAARLVEALLETEDNVAGIKGIYRTRQTSSIARFVQTEFDERYARFTRQKIQPDFADTYSAAYRHALLRQYPFDEALPGAIVEDAELGWRLRRMGYTFRFEPGAIVYHHHTDHFLAYFRRKFRIGRWRVVIYRLYPGQLSSDSHTSQLAKLQMLLLAATLGGLGLSGVSILFAKIQNCIPLRPHSFNLWKALAKVGFIGAAGCFGILQLSFGPFIRRSWQSDPGVALVSGPMLNLRTAGFLSGAIMGLGQIFLEKVIGISRH